METINCILLLDGVCEINKFSLMFIMMNLEAVDKGGTCSTPCK